MGHVVEQRDDRRGDPERQAHGDTPAPETSTEITASPGNPPPAPPIDAEQLRQFRQFQQFQQFLRFQEAQHQAGTDLTPVATGETSTARPPAALPPPPPSRPRAPGWLRWLGKKLLGWLIFFLLLAMALTWAYNYFFGTGDESGSESAAKLGGGTYHTEEILSTEPHEAVRQVYDAIAQESPRTNGPLVAQACGRFDDRTQQRFATNLGYPDCRQAVLALHERVTHVNDYAESIRPRRYDPDATNLRIDSCDFDIQGGPALGVFTVTRVEMGQWLITGHEPGPATCPAPTAATTAATATTAGS